VIQQPRAGRIGRQRAGRQVAPRRAPAGDDRLDDRRRSLSPERGVPPVLWQVVAAGDGFGPERQLVQVHLVAAGNRPHLGAGQRVDEGVVNADGGPVSARGRHLRGGLHVAIRQHGGHGCVHQRGQGDRRRGAVMPRPESHGQGDRQEGENEQAAVHHDGKS
jgi:hypothetical protein